MITLMIILFNIDLIDKNKLKEAMAVFDARITLDTVICECELKNNFKKLGKEMRKEIEKKHLKELEQKRFRSNCT